MREALVDGLSALGVRLKEEQVLSAEALKGSLNKTLHGVGALLIDEAQDMPVRLVGELLERLDISPEKIPPLTVAYDPNQSISNPAGDALNRLVDHMDAIVTLTYCYRSTAQLVEAAQQTLAELHDNVRGRRFQDQHHIDASRDPSTAKLITALSGPQPRSRSAPRSTVIDAVEDELRRMPSSTPVPVIVCGDNELVRELRERLPKGVAQILVPSEAKGGEWHQGLVVDALGPAHGQLTARDYKQMSGRYVALTRFRDRLAVINLEDESGNR
jgi:hypothetical protein